MTYVNHTIGGFSLHLALGKLIFLLLGYFFETSILVQAWILGTFGGIGAVFGALADLIWGAYDKAGISVIDRSLYTDFHASGFIYQKYGKYIPAYTFHVASIDPHVHDPALPGYYSAQPVIFGLTKRDLIWVAWESVLFFCYGFALWAVFTTAIHPTLLQWIGLLLLPSLYILLYQKGKKYYEKIPS